MFTAIGVLNVLSPTKTTTSLFDYSQQTIHETKKNLSFTIDSRLAATTAVYYAYYMYYVKYVLL
jgi:hypothetical protein